MHLGTKMYMLLFINVMLIINVCRLCVSIGGVYKVIKEAVPHKLDLAHIMHTNIWHLRQNCSIWDGIVHFMEYRYFQIQMLYLCIY